MTVGHLQGIVHILMPVGVKNGKQDVMIVNKYIHIQYHI